MAQGRSRVARRVVFWTTVGVVGVLANFGVEVAAERFPSLGLKRFAAYSHKGNG